MSDIQRHPVLSREEEAEFARRFREHKDEAAAEKLVVSNLRFVVKLAHEYRGYGLKILDLVQEGNLGLLKAVTKFDPDRGYRLISYAVWWIRAYIQNYVLRSWSLVKLGTTQAQRKLFFKLRSEREALQRELGGEVSDETLAKHMSVRTRDITEMRGRVGSRDFSLDVQLNDEAKQTHLDMLADAGMDPEEDFAEREGQTEVRRIVHEAMERLNVKERYIVTHRLMTQDRQTLQQIGSHFGISRERARQIEANVLRKLRQAVMGSDFRPQLDAA